MTGQETVIDIRGEEKPKESAELAEMGVEAANDV